MNEKDLLEKLNQVRNLIDECLLYIGGGVVPLQTATSITLPFENIQKKPTLREMVKGKKFGNGQERVAVIVGYHERVLGVLVNKDSIKDGWVDAKMTADYSSVFFARARAKGGLIRVHPDGTCDLTQPGEEFFDKFISNESAQETSQ